MNIINRLYKKFATNKARTTTMSRDDAIKMFNIAEIGLSEKSITVAYALSKFTVTNEMQEFDKYN